MSILVSVRSVWQDPDGSLHIAGDVEVEKFSAYSLSYQPTTAAHYELFAQITDEFLSIAGTVSLTAMTSCVRCLEDFGVVINAPVDAMYFFSETQDDEGEPYPVIGENDVIDILPMLIEAIISEAPFAPLHDKSCKGLCTACGINLNTDSCECDDQIDPAHPFAQLKSLISEGESESSADDEA